LKGLFKFVVEPLSPEINDCEVAGI